MQLVSGVVAQDPYSPAKPRVSWMDAHKAAGSKS